MPDSRGSTESARGSDNVEQAVDRFETAWQNGERPDIADYLPADASTRRAVLVELAHIDLEFRIKSGEPARVETYFRAYPELTGEAEIAVGLIASEFELRRRREPQMPLDEFARRFPEYYERLSLRVHKSHRTTRRSVRLNCPDCRSPIEVMDDGSGSGVQCPCCGSTFPVDQSRDVSWVPERLPRIGQFQLLKASGRGSFGTVYQARDTGLDRIVALKVPRSGQFATEEDEDRFVREARSVAQLRHPGIVPVYEVGRSETFPYIVGEFVDGVTLADWVSARKIGFRPSAELAALVADALDHAHRQGVVHRDLKPSNIMLEPVSGHRGDGGSLFCVVLETESGPRDFRPRLMDFGLARRDEGEVTLTVDGQPLGTPAYMSPEQARGEAHRVTGCSDVYSLGVILYELLVGEPPFRGNSRMLLHQVLYEEPRPPRRLNDRIPRDLETITLRALAKEPNQRYATAGDFAADLRRWLAGEPIVARPIGPLGRAYRWCRRKPALASLIAACALIAFGTAVGIVAWQRAELRWQDAEHQREQQQFQRLVQLRSTAEADEATAQAELAAGRFASAANILATAEARFRDEPAMTNVHARLAARAERVQRIVRFYQLADDAERLEFVEYDDEAYAACSAALDTLGILDRRQWWLHITTEDLSPQQQTQLREDVYRQYLLLVALRAKGGLINFGSSSNAPAYRSALETLKIVEEYRPSHAGRFAERFCQLGLAAGGDLRQLARLSRPLPEMKPTSATDYYFVGILHYWIAAQEKDPLSQIAHGPVRLLGGGIDFAQPRTTAEWMLRKAAQMEPKHYWHHFWLAMILLANGDAKGAELAYNTCIAVNPSFALGYARRAAAIVEQWKVESSESMRRDLRVRALQDLDHAVAIAPFEPMIYWTRARCFLETSDTALAIDAGLNAIELERPLVTLERMRIKLEKEQHLEGAREFATEVLEREPQNTKAWMLRAMAAHELGRDDEALEAAERAIALDPTHARALAVRGSVRLERGDFTGARKDLNATIQNEPTNFRAMIGLAQLEEKTGRLDQAAHAYASVAELAVTPWQRLAAERGMERLRQVVAGSAESAVISADTR